MVGWPEYTMGIWAKSSERRQNRLPCRHCVRLVECPFVSTTTTYAATGAEDLVRARTSAPDPQRTCADGGESNKLIGRQLKLRESTVKVHIRQIMRKQLGATNCTQAALSAAGALGLG